MKFKPFTLRPPRRKLTEDELLLRDMPAVTMKRRELIAPWVKNMTANLESGRPIVSVHHAGIADKVVIVGACPSLDHQHDQLLELKNQGFQVICTDRALAAIKHLVDPDIIAAIDNSPLIDGFLDGYDTTRSRLIASLRVSRDFLARFKGHAYFYISRPSDLEEELYSMNFARRLRLPYIEEYGHVSAAAYVICRLCGARDIRFLGNDYYFLGVEQYSQARKDHFIKRIQYYARPAPNNPKSYWKKENQKETWHGRKDRAVFDTYPVCLDDVQPGQVASTRTALCNI